MQIPTPTPVAETAMGGALASSPFWMPLIHDINTVTYAAAGVFGMIIGAHGVARIVVDLVDRYRRRPSQPSKTGDDNAA